jgi:CDP-diacylglycerol--serine O-phosphatidyltransferase
MFPRPRPRLRVLPINNLAPNILTTLALCAGLTSLRFALLGRWAPAVLAIVVAAVFDALDGRLARLLKGASKFGAELDSLADFVSFGVAPVVLVYMWSLHSAGNFGWLVVLTFSVCCALRLARFNTAAEDPNRPAWSGDFFTGVPSPAAGGLVMLPLMAYLETGTEFFVSPWVNAPWALLIAFLMVSRVPTWSFKRLRVRRDMVMPVLLLTGLFMAALVLEPWITLLGTGVVYVGMMPFGARAHRQLRRRLTEPLPLDAEAPLAAEQSEVPPPPPAPPPPAEHRLH